MFTALRTGLPIDEAKYKEFLQKLDGRPFLICDHIDGQIGISLDSIAGLVRKYNPELVVIDGVYLVTGAVQGKAHFVYLAQYFSKTITSLLRSARLRIRPAGQPLTPWAK